ncbi:MAG: hypothetical protein GY790_00745 [Bacteroidetes bacterium]|nr:hypothetical protein [Bacteroidota bacterium]
MLQMLKVVLEASGSSTLAGLNNINGHRNGEKAVNYSGLIPVLLEAIKEQQGQIELLEQRIAELEQ